MKGVRRTRQWIHHKRITHKRWGNREGSALSVVRLTSSAVESHSQRLESLLTGGILRDETNSEGAEEHVSRGATNGARGVAIHAISSLFAPRVNSLLPPLRFSSPCCLCPDPDLQRDEFVVDHNLLRQEIGSDRGLVLTNRDRTQRDETRDKCENIGDTTLVLNGRAIEWQRSGHATAGRAVASRSARLPPLSWCFVF